jgi:hypothetical protein
LLVLLHPLPLHPPRKWSQSSRPVAPGLPESFEHESWARLSTAVQAIYASTGVQDSMQQLLTVWVVRDVRGDCLGVERCA